MFHLFTFDQYYPQGGFNDYQGSFDSVKEALQAAKDTMRDYYQIMRSDFSIEDYGDVGSL